MTTEKTGITLYLCFDPDQQLCAERLSAWPASNPDFASYNLRDAIAPDSADAATIKLALRKQIESCDVFVCIIAGGSFASPWLDWEIRAARETNPRKGLVGILLKDFFEIPPAMQDCGAMFTPFLKDKVEAAIQWAAENQPDTEDYTLQDD